MNENKNKKGKQSKVIANYLYIIKCTLANEQYKIYTQFLSILIPAVLCPSTQLLQYDVWDFHGDQYSG